MKFSITNYWQITSIQEADKRNELLDVTDPFRKLEAEDTSHAVSESTATQSNS